MNPSGGLFWHLHAWRCQKLWAPTRADIAQWLESTPEHWRSDTDELLIVGASAGWMLPSSWLQGFKRVTTIDLDPWAAPLFRRHHGAALGACGTELHCHTQDALTDLPQILRSHPRSVVLLDNILGQLRFHHDSVNAACAQIANITRSLHGRRWGSVHDAFSGRTQRPVHGHRLPAMQRCVQPAARPANDAVARPVDLGHFSQALRAEGEWLDHLTEQVFPPQTPVHHIAWPYSRRYCHWLQAGWVAA